jgi:hypothetical protein
VSPCSPPPAIDVSGVEEIDAEFQGPVHDLEAFFLGGAPAEVHGAQTDVAYQVLLRLGLRVNFKRMFQRSQAGQFA